MNRHESRKKAVQLLFQIDMTQANIEEAIAYLMENDEEVQDGERDSSFLRTLVEGTAAHQGEIDAQISKFLRGWTMARIANVDRAILRLAGYEMLYENDIPISVTLNEAVELGKLFGTDESPKFINGVLASMAKEVEKGSQK
ncbi:transcription antitermination factor NusB [Aneurinibacillus sp. Ricciae_BoGa-3]|uniref:transcription antitermination factor NusB n=1 Tax=Aneurinibacillus sp. Ricciae_BoGa-3 TaxID=3022697 RepID=UPI0023419648|nr:transcription antitermination factor NusB [Aneurinibacillus sp. Ricciae_BoGa-3]WCK53142.1 transcription antitermination factor NusB [Aneurinibacillus sp. Ricciae_BoGa-3]